MSGMGLISQFRNFFRGQSRTVYLHHGLQGGDRITLLRLSSWPPQNMGKLFNAYPVVT
jgi:hypothetical protein